MLRMSGREQDDISSGSCFVKFREERSKGLHGSKANLSSDVRIGSRSYRSRGRFS